MQHDSDPQLTRDDTGGKPGILLLLHKVLLWSQEGPCWPGGQSTAFIAGVEPRFQGGGGHWRTRLYQRLLKEQELDFENQRT